MIVVSDTSPITSLAAIGKLDLLRQLYSKIITYINHTTIWRLVQVRSRSSLQDSSERKNITRRTIAPSKRKRKMTQEISVKASSGNERRASEKG